MRPPIPETPEQLDAAWFSAALGLPVVDVRVGAADGIAVTSLVARCVLRVEGESEARDTIVKLPRPKWVSGDGNDSYGVELRAYRELELGECAPRCLYQDEAGGRFVLVLETRPGVHSDDGLSADEVLATLDALAALHARYRGGDALVAAGWERRRFDAERRERTRERFERDRRHPRVLRHVDDEVDALFDRMAARFEASYATLAEATITLVHSDLHTHNLLLDRSRDRVRVTLIDWQDASVGPAMLDVAFVLGADARADERHERAWLAHYAAALPLDPAQALVEYRAALDFLCYWQVIFTASYAPEAGEQPVLDQEWQRYLASARAAELL